MGGTIVLESEYGTGSKATVTLTLDKVRADFAAPALPLASPAEQQLVREDKWILVADDNPLLRDILSRTLTQS